MGKYKKLLKNAGIFAIGNVGSSLISFFFVRFYTEFLSQSQYGDIDVMVTTVSLIVPIITLAIVESVLRFSMEKENRIDVLNNGIVVTIVGSIVFSVVGFVIFSFTHYKKFFPYILAMVFFQALDGICAHHSRGAGKTKVFAATGVVRTLTLVLFNLLFLLGLKMGIEGYLLAVILSEMVTTGFSVFASGAYRQLRLKTDKMLLQQMVKYSIPLIPNSLSWWVMNASDKYVILMMLGPSSNGIYAVAHKIPSIINICNNLFFQAWQISAVDEAKSENKESFYSSVFNMLSMSLVIITAILFIIIRLITRIIASDSFLEAWKYSPFLILSMVFAAFASFVGTNYSVKKETTGALKTTLAGAIVNIILNFILVKMVGMSGAAMATMVSYFVVWIYRVHDTKDFVSIKCDWGKLAISLVLLIIQAFLISKAWEFFAYSGATVLLCIVILYKEGLYEILKAVASIKTEFKG